MTATVAYLRIDDPAYPRNARIRRALTEAGHEVRATERTRGRVLPLRILADVHAAVRVSRGADVLVVPEFSLPFVPLAWLIARLTRSLLIVDGFVGMYETQIEDWQRASPGSLRARWCRLVDALAVRLSDVYLCDTEIRAARIRARAGDGTVVISLPVGAPTWIRSQPPNPHRPLRVLYSGGALPLHGVPFILRALAQTADRSTTLSLVLAAPDARKREFEGLAAQLGVSDRCTFVPPVSHAGLIRLVHAHHVVLGVFGDSPKARSVIANKVWQGLAAGRTVVTRSGAALAELAEPAAGLLIAVHDERELAETWDRLARTEALPYDPGIGSRLDAYVDEAFLRFLRILEAKTKTGPRRR